jgi:hypothetical protein
MLTKLFITSSFAMLHHRSVYAPNWCGDCTLPHAIIGFKIIQSCIEQSVVSSTLTQRVGTDFGHTVGTMRVHRRCVYVD